MLSNNLTNYIRWSLVKEGIICVSTYAQWARKLKKYSTKKNLWNQINKFHEIFLAKFYFLQFQEWPKIHFWTGKKFKTAKNAISWKKVLISLFHNFFVWTFLNFLARCAWFLPIHPVLTLLLSSVHHLCIG